VITHYIYLLPNRKIGCTKNLERRMTMYEEIEGKRPNYKILEKLYNVSDQEAGDREWYWADELGYKRGNHYTITMKAYSARGKTWGLINSRRLNSSLSSEERSARARSAGLVGGPIGGFRYIENTTSEERSQNARRATAGLTPEQRSENARKGPARLMEITTSEQRSERARKAGLIGSKTGGCVQSGICPHCGKESTNLAILKRWHFDKCPKKIEK